MISRVNTHSKAQQIEKLNRNRFTALELEIAYRK